MSLKSPILSTTPRRGAACVALLTGLLTTRLAAQGEAPEWTDLALSPRAVSEPLLGRRLLPDRSLRRPGNAAVILLRLCCDKNPILWERLVENSKKHLDAPPGEFSPDQAREDVPLWSLEELQRAAFRAEADWQYPFDGKTRLDETELSDIVDTRHILRGLAVHSRADIAEGRIDSALDKVTVGLALAEHLQKTPFVLTKSIQADSMGLFFDRVQELVQREEASNLYWALTALPERLIDLHTLIDVEGRARLWHVPETRDLDRERSPREWRELRQRIGVREFEDMGGLLGHVIGEDKPLTIDLKRARRELPKLEPSLANRVAAMSDDEVTIRYFVVRYSIVSDRLFAGLLLPPPQGVPLIHEAAAPLNEEDPAIADSISDVAFVYARAWGLRRRVDALRIIEALRDYGARHDGELPYSLAAVERTPIPIDAVSGKPYDYRREDQVASLSAEAVEICGKELPGIRYRIRFRRAK